ncbi:L-aspartate oxidase [Alkalibacter mobilis]|uniref:L-aspartate oxidase n=1 Tax=Alkalibacter mobilis TaxID=2787712 RepID=UPI00189D85BF|nr:L-aspartate oxidase [Alkalibacter mobilis]MBF7097485.1 L-aspartate oxidase [Alkalibacter mobilis]
MEEFYDVIVVGSGIAGLNTCLNLDRKLRVLLVAKDELSETNTSLAQGGIAVAKDVNDVPFHVEDTMKAGKYHNDLEAVKIMVEESFQNIRSIMDIGVVFDRSNGDLDFTREGGHCRNRILHVKDKTGEYISKAMIDGLREFENLEISDHSTVLDIMIDRGACIGVILKKNEEVMAINSKIVVMATGGVGGLFKSSTNRRILSGDGIGIAIKNNVAVKDLKYIQFHPTVLYDKNINKRKILITEALRGEGALLYNLKGERFVDELAPRDIVCEAIKREASESEYVLLDISFKNKDFIINRFPTIYSQCMENGIDITKSPIPVFPAQHYIMGGIKVDTYSRTSLKNLYAAGETSCTGVHGKNRLASNSLLEGLVFSARGAKDINYRADHIKRPGKKYSVEKYFDEGFDPGEILIEEIKKRTDRYNDEFK